MKNRISLIANINLAIYAGLLPWGNALANIHMGAMVLFFVLSFAISPRIFEFSRSNLLKWTVFSSYFLVCLLSLIYTDNLERGIDSIVRKLPLIIFPAYIIFIKEIDRKWIRNSLKVFSFSVLAVSIISLSIALYNSIKINDSLEWEYLTGARLSGSLIATHKLYFGLYIVFAILFFVYEFASKPVSFRKAWPKYVGVTFLISFLLLLGTRTTMVTALLFVFLFATYVLWKRKEYIKNILLLFGASVFITLAISYNPVLKERFKEAVNFNNEYHISKQWGGTAVRKLIWKYSSKVVFENSILGVGLGDAQEELNKSYLNCKESTALKGKNYNAHSEILQILVNTGILGVIAFYGSQIFIISHQNRKNRLLTIFILLFFFSGLTESYLERDMGIRVYSFFSVLLYFLIRPDESTPSS